MSFVRSNVVRRAAPVQSQSTQPGPSQQSTSPPDQPLTTRTAPTPTNTTPIAHAAQSALSSLPASLLPSTTPPPPPVAFPLPGTRSWLHSLAFVPSGLPDLDSLLSGGLYLHSLSTLAEDEAGQWDAFARLFAAEAAEWQQPVLTLSTRTADAEREWMRRLPRAVKHRTEHKGPSEEERSDALRIAWRYGAYKDRPQDAQSNMRASSVVAATGQRSHSLSHTFNLRLHSTHPADYLSALHSHIQVADDGDDIWSDLYDKLGAELERLCGGSGAGSAGRVVRVIVRSAADIDWCALDSTGESHRRFLLFLHRLRGLLQRYPAVCLLTYPPSLLSASTVATVHHLSTLALTLHTLPPGSPYRDYDSLLRIHPQPPVHSLVSEAGGGASGGGEWLVECREVVRLDKVSLPPEESRNEEGQGQAAPGAKERGKVVVEKELVAESGVRGGPMRKAGAADEPAESKAGHKHAHGVVGCGSSGGSDW